MVPGSPPLAVSSKTTIFTNPERLPSPAYSFRSRLRVMKRSGAADLCNPYDPRARPGSTRTPIDPPRGRPRDVLRWSWISTGQHPDGASSAGHCRVAWRPSRTPRFAPRRPLLGPGQSKPIGIRARSAFAAQEPPSWMRHDESRRIVDREALPRPAWFAHLLSWARGPGGWRGRRARALSRRDRTHRGRQAPRLRRLPGFQGRRSLSPTKGSAIGRTQGAFHQGSSPRGRIWPGKPRQILTARRVNSCPQVVPILWRRSPRLFYPAQTLR
jgi:hypothetical protein